MPRAQESKETQILNWFKTAPLTVAVLILGLVKDGMRERVAKHEAAKKAQEAARNQPVPAATPARQSAPKPVAKKKTPKAAAKPAGKAKPPAKKAGGYTRGPLPAAKKRSHHKKATPVHHPPVQVDPGPDDLGDFNDTGDEFTLPETE